MKKLYISCPMRELTKEQIESNRTRMKKIAEAIFDQELEVIDTFISFDPPATNAIAIWNLGENIKKIAAADYFIGINDCWDNPGCSIEKEVAEIYLEHEKIFFINKSMIGLPDGYPVIPVERGLVDDNN